MTIKSIYSYTPLRVDMSTKKTIAEWLIKNSWRSIWGISLTFKQARRQQNIWVQIDETQAKRAFKHFLNRLNRSLYGRNFRQYGRRLKVIPVLEKTRSGRWHYHLAIEAPAHIDAKEFARRIRQAWYQVDWAYEEMDIQPNANAAWITEYLPGNKNGQKDAFEYYTDCLDIGSLFLG
jgi:hypothetical protein